jgi:hypothetical protein
MEESREEGSRLPKGEETEEGSERSELRVDESACVGSTRPEANKEEQRNLSRSKIGRLYANMNSIRRGLTSVLEMKEGTHRLRWRETTTSRKSSEDEGKYCSTPDERDEGGNKLKKHKTEPRLFTFPNPRHQFIPFKQSHLHLRW